MHVGQLKCYKSAMQLLAMCVGQLKCYRLGMQQLAMCVWVTGSVTGQVS